MNPEINLSTISQDLTILKQYALLAAKKVLTINDVALLTGLSKSHLYKLTSSKEIPHYKPNNKFVFFDKAEIENWQKQNRIKTNSEIEQEAISYCTLGLKNKKGGAI